MTHGGRSNVMRTYGVNQTNRKCYYKLQCGHGQYGQHIVTKDACMGLGLMEIWLGRM